MNNLREHLYLAALLHDIGKFYRRATRNESTDLSPLNEIIKNQGETQFPAFDGQALRQECLWTAHFIEKYKVVFSGLEKEVLPQLSAADELVQLAAGYQRADEELTELGKILKKADLLAGGLKGEVTEDAGNSEEKETAAHQTMCSILQYIKGGKPDTLYGLPLKALSLEKSAFAVQKTLTADYATLWKQFENDFKFIQSDRYKAFAETLLSLLFKYTTAVPTNVTTLRDVSLYDHSKMTAALAVSLYDFLESGEQAEAPFLLIGADFSGIQNYIYQIVSKYAGRNLKGRSFYLRLLSDTIVRYLLRELHLYQAHVIYNSGGSFYILAPNTSFTREVLEKCIKQIEKHLYETHGISLYVALDAVEMSEADLLHRSAEQNLPAVWKKLFEKRDRKKNGKFAHLLAEDYTSFFTPHHKGGIFMRDSITGEELTLSAKFRENLRLNPDTYEQIELGRKLSNTDFMVVSEVDIPGWEKMTHLQPIQLGFHYYFVTLEELKGKNQPLRETADSATIISLNGKDRNCDFLQQIEGLNNIYSLEFYGGNENGHLTFEQMCEQENEDAFHRLGVLRMDVDNLGSIFQSGISPEKATLSRYATLSRSFDFFFSGYLNTLQQEVAPNRSSIIYSGGDDVFIVGSWEDTIRIAERIHTDFAEYTCHNPAFSISGGIAIVEDKFPIMKGAEFSADEESRAKHHHTATECKNSLSFMQTALNWDCEFPQVKDLKTELVKFIDLKILNKSFLSKIQKHAANAQIEHHQVRHIKTYWMLTYDLARFKKECKAPEVEELISHCINEVCHDRGKLNGETIQTEYHPLELWNFAARWAELEIRTTKK